ncbi:MAG: hypothetical protein B6I20_12855 [Bacteroidetes bacterium 4572_117]|nr:MAG: hypothetical protein B6I20_12855 [Bacteroidetes bacterium 4572_117]
MKKIIFSVGLFFVINSVFAQVGGLSASKLGTLCTETVPAQTIEFEPFFSFASSSRVFDKKGDVQNLFATNDSSQFFSEPGFRFSYGLMKNLEVGVSIPTDISTVSFGAKYKLPFKGKLTFGLLVGYNSIVGNDIYVRRNAAHETSSSIGGGIILTYEFSDKFSCDFNAQYHKHLNKTSAGHDQGMCFSTDFGYYFIENVNFIIGMNYFFEDYEVFEDNSRLFTFNPGIAIEKAENFILVLNSPIDLFGKNEYKSVGFGLALTIILD